MQFVDSSHSYTNTNNKTYRSVSSVLSALEPKKDWDEIAKKYAKKHNLTLEQVKASWQHEKDISLIRGKRYHSAEESKILGSEYAIVTEDGQKVQLPIIKSVTVDDIKYESKQELSDGIYPELMIWLDEYEVAGQADKVEIYDKLITIVDYKTNKKIEKSGWVDFKTGQTKKLLDPCTGLDDCNFMKYSLQLNFYAYMIKQNNPGYRIKSMILRHVLFNEDGDPIGTKDHLVPHLQREIMEILSYVKRGKL